MSDYDKFSKAYSDSMAEQGDYFHQTQIDPFMYGTIGKVEGKTLYDIGCGNGYMARNFARKGASVFASDLSENLVEEAKSISGDLDITYNVHDAINFDLYKDNQFDFVTSNMVIHYIEDLEKLFSGISRILKPNGVFAFSTNSVFRPPHPYSDWILGEVEGKEKLFIKTTGYLEKRVTQVKAHWDKNVSLNIVNHPLSEIASTLSKYNLYIFQVHEPESVGFAKDFSEELQKSHHIPTFMTIGAKKIS